jgi:hypothetical protein
VDIAPSPPSVAPRWWKLAQAPSSALRKLALDYAVLTLASVIAAVWFVDQRVTSLDGFLIAFFPPSVVFALALKGSYKNAFRAVALDKIGHVLTGASISAIAVLGLHEVFVNGAPAGPRVLSTWALAVGLLRHHDCGHHCRAATSEGERPGNGDVDPGNRAGRCPSRAAVDVNIPSTASGPWDFLDIERPPDEHLLPSVPFLGGFESSSGSPPSTTSSTPFLAFSTMRDSDKVSLIKNCELLGVKVTVVPRFFDVVNSRSRFEFIGGLPLVRTEPVIASGWRYSLKHFLDRLIAAILCLVAAPLLIALAVAVKVTSPGPILFRQPRIGRDGREFNLLKFRSMRIGPSDGAPFEPGEEQGSGRRRRA